jgi:hypothetical protein
MDADRIEASNRSRGQLRPRHITRVLAGLAVNARPGARAVTETIGLLACRAPSAKCHVRRGAIWRSRECVGIAWALRVVGGRRAPRMAGVAAGRLCRGAHRAVAAEHVTSSSHCPRRRDGGARDRDDAAGR